MSKICVALSGGVDSTAAAILLQQEGHRVSGITMDSGYLSTEGAIRVAEHLGVPLRIVNLRREFEKEVVRPTLKSYQQLTTPNPCAWCNIRLKFGLLMEIALQEAELYATGHYACLSSGPEGIGLKEAQARESQSQAYFLAMVPKERLSLARFPLCRTSRREAEELVRQVI
jgi:tRNA-specific 2-thiouridylase